jgi:NAD(P)-dependent dehydrogenase (short-subunit alcohol dehydrogenase family)
VTEEERARRGQSLNALRPGELPSSTDKLEEKMPKLDGKIAVITGGNSGIGLATAKVFVKEGARVYITGRRQAELDAAAALLGPSAKAVQGDVAKPADLDRLYDQIRDEVGRVDVVFANAGGVIPAPLGSLTEEHIDYHLDVHVKGAIWTIQKALPLMGPGGSIILSASIVASKGWADWSVYSASKAAVRSFARTWSSDLRGRGIRVNAVSPGVIPTPAHENAAASPAALNSFMEYAASITPLARTGTVEEVAKAVAFLASDDSSFIAASEIFVDGGIAQI